MEHLGSLESTQEARVEIGYRLEQLFRSVRALQTSLVLHSWIVHASEPVKYNLLFYCHYFADLKEHCHATWQLYKKLEEVFSHQLNFKTNNLMLLLKVPKLFPVTCRYGWHGWKWIETLKNWQKLAIFFQVLRLHVPKMLKKFIVVSHLR